MTNREHERAIELITRRGVDDITAADATWLESHLATCAECSEYAALANSTGRLLRSVAITASPALISATQARVRARAVYLREQRSRMVLIAISFCIGAMSSALSAWLWWRFGGWVAQRVGLSSAIVEPGILLFLVLPAIVIAGLVLAFPHPLFDGSLMLALAREHEGEKR
jgi:anti-sigma factor RsiW